MPIVDLSFSNPRVKAFFKRTPGAPAPTSELLYIHSHLLGASDREDFLSQLETFIATTDYLLVQNPKKRGVADRIAKSAVEVGKLLSDDLSEQVATDILAHLRDIHDWCAQVNRFRLTDDVLPAPIQTPELHHE